MRKISRNHCIIGVLVCFAAASLVRLSVRAQASPPVPVKAIRVSLQSDQVSIPVAGVLRCADTLHVGFEGTGVVSKILVEEGDTIAEGQVLAELDNAMPEAEDAVKKAELDAADAELKYFTAEMNKMDALHDKKAISDTDFEKATRQTATVDARRKILQAEYQALAAKKQQRILRSPISGLVAKRYVEPGSVVTPGFHQVLRLLRCQEMVSVIELGERYYPMVKRGQPIRLSVEALGDRELTGTIHRVSTEIEKPNHTFLVEARFSNEDLTMAGGMHVRGSVEATTGYPSVWIPKSGLISADTKRTAVFVIQENKLVHREVIVGLEHKDRVEILSGLTDGDVVAIEGHGNLPALAVVAAVIPDAQ